MSVSVAVQQRLRLFREGLGRRLAASEDIEVVGVVRAPEELVGLCRAFGPDVVLMDSEAEEWDVIALARSLLRSLPGVRLIGLAGGPAGGRGPLAAPRWGLHAMVSRAGGVEEIVGAIRCDPWRGRPARVASSGSGERRLTYREAGVLDLVCAGCTSREISDRLGISARTVEDHKQSAFRKLGVRNRAHAAAVVFGAGRHRPAGLTLQVAG